MKQPSTSETAEDELVDVELQNIRGLYRSALTMGGQTGKPVGESYASAI